MAARHLSLGARGEAAAADMLAKKGYKVLERNWRFGRLELDLVCRRGKLLVFVEVKTRGPGSLAAPEQAVDRAKQANLAKAAQAYLSAHDLWDAPCRFDVVAVADTGSGLELKHMEDAIDTARALGGGHTHWQPW